MPLLLSGMKLSKNITQTYYMHVYRTKEVIIYIQITTYILNTIINTHILAHIHEHKVAENTTGHGRVT